MINTETIQTEKRNQKEDKFHEQKDLLVKFRFFVIRESGLWFDF